MSVTNDRLRRFLIMPQITEGSKSTSISEKYRSSEEVRKNGEELVATGKICENTRIIMLYASRLVIAAAAKC